MPPEILHERETGDLYVLLLWHRDTGDVQVSVFDRATDETFVFVTDRAHALDAFYHPFCYLAPNDCAAAA
jgi:hypothetical protein